MASRPPKDPLIAIIGATGTGKSKLAIELATRFNGEVVNGDAMQMYKGLPIITNKVPESERHGIPHHLLDFINLHEEPWTVRTFVREAEKVVKEIRSRGKLPILVGGTHYYAHGLLLEDALLPEGNSEDNNSSSERQNEARGGEQSDIVNEILSTPTEEMYARLQAVDPVMASRWHPKDRRKIQRSLEVYLKTGRKPSDIYEEQKRDQNSVLPRNMDGALDADVADNPSHAGLRFPTLIFWLEAEDHVLKARLNARVHDMIATGMLEEASSMADLERHHHGRGQPIDKSKGVWVSIGYKELGPFISARHDGSATPQDLQAMQHEGVEAIQASTRQYAKRQNRYIRIRLANALQDAGGRGNLYVLDSTESAQWHAAVTATSIKVVESFLKGDELPEPKSLSPLADRVLSALISSKDTSKTRASRTCEVCHKVLMSEKEWQGHLKSRGHRNVFQGSRKRVENEARRAAEVTAADRSDSLH